MQDSLSSYLLLQAYGNQGYYGPMGYWGYPQQGYPQMPYMQPYAAQQGYGGYNNYWWEK